MSENGIDSAEMHKTTSTLQKTLAEDSGRGGGAWCLVYRHQSYTLTNAP